MSLCNPSCPGTHYVELRDQPGSASRVVGLRHVPPPPDSILLFAAFQLGKKYQGLGGDEWQWRRCKVMALLRNYRKQR